MKADLRHLPQNAGLRTSARRTAVIAFLLAIGLGRTASAAEPQDEATKNARRRFQEGVAAADAGNYEAARVAFQQAYALKQHHAVLQNLGQSELRTGHYVEAARHLALFLTDNNAGTAQEREAVRAALAEAETKVGKLVLTVDVEGAEVTVDGDAVGRSPFAAPFYFEPGQRTLRVRRDGYRDVVQTQQIEAGRTTQVKIAMSSGQGDSTVLERPVFPDVAGDTASGWTPAKTAVIASGAGLAVVALGVGVVFTMKGGSLDSDAQARLESVNVQLGQAGCTGAAASSPLCSDLNDLLDRRNAANKVAIGAFIGAGVIGAATIVTAIAWPRSKKAVALAPAAYVGGGGLMLRGEF
jgi:tetratricopeptide (TPR) repeat protein